MKKKLLAMLLAVSCVFSITACASEKEEPETTVVEAVTEESETETTEESVVETETVTETEVETETEPVLHITVFSHPMIKY